ncbi:hypothetical protein N9043_00820 [bacterium]|nr:hypothetical protein [bacterium]
MSFWTEVTGVIKFDSIDADELKAVKDALKNSPEGSEGNLEVDISETASKHEGLVTLTALITSALRSYGDEDHHIPDLIAWIQEIMDLGSFCCTDSMVIKINNQDSQLVLRESVCESPSRLLIVEELELT